MPRLGPSTWLLAAATVGIVLTFLLSPAEARPWILSLEGGAAGLAVIAAVAVRRPPNPRSWATIGLSLTLTATGNTLAAATSGVAASPGASIANAVLVVGCLTLLIGVGMTVRTESRSTDVADWLDAALLTVGAALVAWLFVLEPYAAAHDPIESVLLLLQPTVDLLIVGLLIRVWITPRARTPALALLSAGLVVFVLSDFGFVIHGLGGPYPGDLVDLGWLLASLLVLLASLHRSMGRLAGGAAQESWVFGVGRRALLVAAPLAVPVSLVVHAGAGGVANLAVPVVAASVMGGLVVVRLMAALGNLRHEMDARRTLEGQLVHQAEHDALTGLANRALFTRRLAEALTADHGAAVIFIDLDDFKTVNDTFGHGAGDALLVAVSARIRDSVRPDDTPARLGGDEFAVLLSGPGHDRAATSTADRILQSVRAPIAVHGYRLTTRASIGIATAPAHADPDELMRHADSAMYLAKGQGKDRVESFGSVPQTSGGDQSSVAIAATSAEAIAASGTLRQPALRRPPTGRGSTSDEHVGEVPGPRSMVSTVGPHS